MMTHPMPTYVYKCDNDHSFEVMQPMADDALDACEVCGAPARRMLFAPAVHFKGSGFYTTDYARKGAAKDGDGTGESKSEGSSESKGSDSKSESKGAGSKSGESKGSGSKSGDSKGSGSTGSDSKQTSSKN